MSSIATAPILSPAEVRAFHQRGFLGPYSMCSPAEMAPIRERLDQLRAAERAERPEHPHAGVHNMHLRHRLMYDLAAHPAIIALLTPIVGEDLLLWRTHIWDKQPHGAGKEIPWHQDIAYWPIEPPALISVWLAIDPVGRDNSCTRLIPGSHGAVLPTVDAPAEMQFGKMADPRFIDRSKAVEMILEPGQFFIFTERTLHQSDRNDSERRRLGVAFRYILPQARITGYDSDEHGAVQVSGRDPLGFNRLVEPPTE